jgi:hypothetical protein
MTNTEDSKKVRVAISILNIIIYDKDTTQPTKDKLILAKSILLDLI